MSLFAFICAKTTADFVIPGNSRDLTELNRRVSIFAKGLVGGTLTVGDIKFRTTQDAVANHLLCDGSTIQRAQFPELVEYLNPGQPSATLPDLSGGLTVSTPTVTQTVTETGTVDTGGTVEPAGTTGGTTGGNIPSGGRIRPLRAGEQEP